MNIHQIIYLIMALTYVEAAFNNFGKRDGHDGWRDLVVATLYGSIALFVVDHSLIPLQA
jgi:hypothetical protein